MGHLNLSDNSLISLERQFSKLTDIVRFRTCLSSKDGISKGIEDLNILLLI